MPKQEVGLSTMKRIDKVVRRIRRKQQPELDGRITNETEAEHLQQIYARVRPLKYPLQ